VTSITVELRPKQLALVNDPSRLLNVIGTTKSGKTWAGLLWLADGLLRGERVALVAPWYKRVRANFETLRDSVLAVPIAGGAVLPRETDLSFSAPHGGALRSFSGDNAQALYGDRFHRVLCDEASRCPPEILPAMLTTTAATGGKLRLLSNTDRGGSNWAIRRALAAQAMSDEERAAAGESVLVFGFGDGFISEEARALAERTLPSHLYAALYRGEVPASDASLFRLEGVFGGVELSGPLKGHTYVLGVDLARKRDFTVAVVLDTGTGEAVAHERFSEISWALQVERVVALYRRFACRRAYVDASGLGDPLVEEFGKHGVACEPVVFTTNSRREMIEALVVACEQGRLKLPASWSRFEHELGSFTVELTDAGEPRYVAQADHDDTVMALALAWRGFRASIGPWGIKRGVAPREDDDEGFRPLDVY
jgi:phage terminase large subunit-like protein